ncbi:MAG: hypothetical protein WBD36_15680 [Bacteroidota bacterium]
MRKRMMLAFVAMVVALLTGCGKQEAKRADITLIKSPENSAGGIVWSYPSRWVKGEQRMMRAATYAVPAAQGDAEGGECAVFYFGSQQGGTVDMNIERWGSQFENAKQVVKTTLTVGDVNITRVQLGGTYLAPSGPMMESQGKKENYLLLGAIAEAPEGMVFFKFTGPAKTVEGAEAEFDAMIQSVSKK